MFTILYLLHIRKLQIIMQMQYLQAHPRKWSTNCLPTMKETSEYLPVYPSLLGFFASFHWHNYFCWCWNKFEPGSIRKIFSVCRCGYAPDCPDSCGSTPLMDALRTGHVLVAETLIKEHKVQQSESNMKYCLTKVANVCCWYYKWYA